MLESTLDVLRKHEYVRGDEQVDRKTMAKSIADVLSENVVSTADSAEIQEKALLVPEITFKLFGDVDDEDAEDELTEITRSLVVAAGQVQDALENGHVLCTAKVTRKVGEDGQGSFTITKPGRFVSDNPDAVERHFDLPAIDRFVKAGATIKARLELSERRIPELANRRQALIAGAHQRAQEALPPAPEATE